MEEVEAVPAEENLELQKEPDNRRILQRTQYTNYCNHSDLIKDIKININRLSGRDTIYDENQDIELTSDNRLFIKIILNIQFFLLNNPEPPYPNNDWLISFDYNSSNHYIYNLLSILFGVKTFKLIDTFYRLIRDPNFYDTTPSIYNLYSFYFEELQKQNPKLNKPTHILNDIIVKPGSPHEELYKLPFMNFLELNKIKWTAVSQFIQAYISFNDNIQKYREIKQNVTHDKFLFEFLKQIYENSEFQMNIRRYNESNVDEEKKRKYIEINNFIYTFIEPKVEEIFKYNYDNQISKIDYIIEKFNYIKNILKNIENPFLQLINKLKGDPNMNGYIQYIKHILYQIPNPVYNIVELFQFLDIDVYILPEGIEGIEEMGITQELYDNNKLNYYSYKSFADLKVNYILNLKRKKQISLDEKYQEIFNIFEDENKYLNNIELLLLKPTNEIIQYFSDILSKIKNLIEKYKKVKIPQDFFTFNILKYIRHNLHKGLTHPTDIENFEFLITFDKDYYTPEREEQRNKAEEAERKLEEEKQKRLLESSTAGLYADMFASLPEDEDDEFEAGISSSQSNLRAAAAATTVATAARVKNK
jgi:hypothetical protein